MKEEFSQKRKKFKIICLGNFLDFLEFGLFSAMLPFISRELFPDISAFSRTTLSYFIVYVGFLGRPIGGLFLGRLGDLKGPYFVFTLSVVGISIASGLLAFVPISALSAAFLVTLRFFQGFFTGAEQATAMICASSNLEKNSSHMRIVFVTMSGIVGVAFAQVIAYSLSVLAPNRVGVWRELFVLISFLSLCVFILRVLSFKKLKFEKKEGSSLQKRSKNKVYWPKIAQAAILVGIVNSIFYFVNNYINTHSMIRNLTIDTSKFLVNMIATSCFALFLFFWGKFLINKNYKFSTLMKVGMVGTSLFLFLSFLFFESSMIKILFSQMGLVFFAQLMTVTVLNEILYVFPKEIKTQSLGVSLSLGNSVIGGAVPLTSSLFLSNNSNSFMPLIYLFLLIVIGMYCVKLIDEERKKGSDEGISSI